MKIESGTEMDVTLVSEGQDEPLLPPPKPAAEPVVRARDPKAPLTPAEGDLVAERYRVGPVIGAGGMGIVYRATHVELGTAVALKVIRPDMARNSSIWRRFSREARALGALSNRHVVRVNDAGTLASGLRYLVMELLEGIDLRRLLQQRGALPREQAVDYAIQVCSALGDAHRLNIIHRDIKPENIFIANVRGSEPEVKLLDFGVALFLEDAGQLTVPGRGVGSPQYLSPEQMQNPSGVDQRSDIWAVGLLLYELLSGLSPFHGLNPAETGLLISKGPIPRIDDVHPDIPKPLAAVIQHCLEIKPERRPQSAEELSAALAPFSSRAPDAAPPPAAPPKLGLMPRLFGLGA
jgi:serine/threonine-protein kinase